MLTPFKKCLWLNCCRLRVWNRSVRKLAVSRISSVEHDPRLLGGSLQRGQRHHGHGNAISAWYRRVWRWPSTVVAVSSSSCCCCRRRCFNGDSRWSSTVRRWLGRVSWRAVYLASLASGQPCRYSVHQLAAYGRRRTARSSPVTVRDVVDVAGDVRGQTAPVRHDQRRPLLHAARHPAAKLRHQSLPWCRNPPRHVCRRSPRHRVIRSAGCG